MAEEVQKETYENFHFLTIAELRSLSMDHLIGKTNLLRPYMHGYFVASKLYDQARLIANPYVYEEDRMKRVKEKAEKERASRIRSHKKVKVNQKLVDRLLKKQENRETVDVAAGLLGDTRFKKLFEDDEFAMGDEYTADADGDVGTATRKARPAGEQSDSSDSSGDEGGSVGKRYTKTKRSEQFVMRVSSSKQQKGGSRAKDTALGSRIQKSGRISKRRPTAAVGERQVTFVPESKKREKQVPVQPARHSGSRRSASANTFRKL